MFVLPEIKTLKDISEVPSFFKSATFVIGRIEEGAISMVTKSYGAYKLELVIEPADFKAFEYWTDATLEDYTHHLSNHPSNELTIKLHKAKSDSK